MNEFKYFTSHLKNRIFEETSMYLSDVVGTDGWKVISASEEVQEVHGIIMYNAVEAIAKEMGIIKNK